MTEAPMFATIEAEAPDAMQAVRDANAAVARGDRAAALAILESARTVQDAPVEAWIDAVKLYRDAGDDREAVSLLQHAALKFPASPEVMQTLASHFERIADWSGAERYWTAFIRLVDDKWWACAGLVRAVQNQGRVEEAENLLNDMSRRLPNEPEMAAAMARFLQSEKKFTEALLAWDDTIARFSTWWFGYRGKIALLNQLGRGAEADEFFLSAVRLFPDNVDALHDVARAAERRRDWQQAEIAWRGLLALDRRHHWAFRSLAVSLREQGKLSDCDAVLDEAVRLFPADRELASDRAKCSEVRNDWLEAARRWRGVAKSFPKSPGGTLGEAALLRRHGLSEAADDIVSTAVRRFPDEPSLLEALGLNAMAREDWTESLARLEAGQQRFPSYDPFRRLLFEVGLRLADSGQTAPAILANTAARQEKSDQDRVLVMDFESLGGGGHGCEFGIFQRSFGAEPLGLLRWADVFQDALCDALDTNLAGIGEPEFTNIFVPVHSGEPEYWTTDRRYHMAMRSFVPVSDMPIQRMRLQVTRRLTYLRRKLLEDLAQGPKIFVYKNMKRNLTDAELLRLHKSCRRHGDNTLFYIKYEDAANPCGTVVKASEGLLVGYIDHFSHTPDTDEFIGPATNALLGLCKRARAIWKPE